MVKFSTKYKGMLSLSALLLVVMLLVPICWPLVLKFAATEYRTIESPDGNYKIVVYRIPAFSISMPGQSGDAPGYVRLYDKVGRILEEQNVDMVQNIDHADWEDNKVRIKLFAEWDLPH